MSDTVWFTCTRETYRPASSPDVRWLDIPDDIPHLNGMWRETGSALTEAEWRQIAADGYTYAGVILDGRLISVAAVFKFSEDAWMLAAVGTSEPFRRRGLAKQTCSFVTGYILDHVPTATCGTRSTNDAMIRTAKRIGVQ